MSNLWQGLGNKLIGSLHGSEAIEVRKAWCENPVVLLNHFDRHSSMYVSARAKRNCRDLEQYAGDLPI